MKKLIALVLALVMVLGLVACGGNNPDSSNTTPSTDPMSDTTATTAPRELTTLEKLLLKDEEGIPAFAKRGCPFRLDELTDNEAISLASHMSRFMSSMEFIEHPSRFDILADRWYNLLSYLGYQNGTTTSRIDALFYKGFQNALKEGVPTHHFQVFTRVPCKSFIQDFYKTRHSVTYMTGVYHTFHIFDERELRNLTSALRMNESFNYDAGTYLALATGYDGYVRDAAMEKLDELTQANWSVADDPYTNRNAQIIMLNCMTSGKLAYGKSPLTEEECDKLWGNIMNNDSIDLGLKLVSFYFSDNDAAALYGKYCAEQVATDAGNMNQYPVTQKMLQDGIEHLLDHEDFTDWEMTIKLQQLSGLLK